MLLCVFVTCFDSLYVVVICCVLLYVVYVDVGRCVLFFLVVCCCVLLCVGVFNCVFGFV